jgi:glycerol-3-phosphate cytidylyltransferase
LKNARDNAIISLFSCKPTHIYRTDKNIPVQSIHERHPEVRARKYVDEVVVYETEQDLHNLLCSVKFDKRFIGADWEGKQFTGRDIPGMPYRVVFNSRNHGFSTTNLRKRVFEAELENREKFLIS